MGEDAIKPEYNSNEIRKVKQAMHMNQRSRTKPREFTPNL